MTIKDGKPYKRMFICIEAWPPQPLAELPIGLVVTVFTLSKPGTDSSTKVPDSSPELASHNTMYTNNNYLMIILSHSGCKIVVTCDTAQLS